MSRDDRDQKGGHPRRGGRGLCRGCEWCKPPASKTVRRRAKNEIRYELELMLDRN